MGGEISQDFFGFLENGDLQDGNENFYLRDELC